MGVWRMSNESAPVQVKLGLIEGVHIWKMPNFLDIRGSLCKLFVGGRSGSFPLDFTMYEHFFTRSRKNVFRGMHFQGSPHEVVKIVSIIQGNAIDFLLDMRESSESYGHLQIQTMDQENPVSIYIPVGVAHGYLSLEDNTIISYKMDGAFCPNCDGGISGDIVKDYLPIDFEKTIRSEKDSKLSKFSDFEYVSNCLK